MQQNTKHELKVMLRLSLPAILTQLTLISMPIVDTIMAGGHSEQTISAVSIGSSMLYPVTVIMFGLFSAMNPIAAQLNAKKDYHSLTTLAVVGVLFAIIMAAPYGFILWKSQYFLELLDINVTLIPLSRDYLISLSYGLPSFFVFLALRFFNDGLFSSKKVLMACIFVFPFNLILNWILMYGKLGFDELGVIGLGYSTSISWTLLALYMIRETVKNKDLDFTIPIQPALCWKNFKSILKVGAPIACQICVELLTLSSIGLFIGRLDVSVVAGHQISMSLCSLFTMLPLGVSTAITARSAYFFSQRNEENLIKTRQIGMLTALALCCCSGIILVVFSTALINLYTTEKQVLEVASMLMVFVAVNQILSGLVYAAAGFLRGVKDVTFTAYVNVVAYWMIGLPFGFYMANSQQMQVKGYWLGLLIANTIAASSFLHRAYRGPKSSCLDVSIPVNNMQKAFRSKAVR